MNIFKKITLLMSLCILLVPFFSHAQENEVLFDKEEIIKAQVLEVTSSTSGMLQNIDLKTQSQTIKAKVLEGGSRGKEITFQNDYIQLEDGQEFYVRHHISHEDKTENWSVADPYRLPVLFGLTALFIVVLVLFGGIQGVRGLLALVGSVFLIFYLLIPGIYAGHNAVLVSILVSSVIIIVGSYITHGFTRTTSSAVIGMILTVIMTGVCAYFAVHLAHLSGFSSEENTYLALDTKGKIDMVGLLFGGIMIGLLGVLYDIAIGQAVAVEELFRAGKTISKGEVYRRGLRIGREHIGALVNTLAIAYVGAALPLLLLVQSSTNSIGFILNSELFATEIIRILVGSIGLILAVPVTTFVAVRMLDGKVRDTHRSGHSHSHVHSH